MSSGLFIDTLHALMLVYWACFVLPYTAWVAVAVLQVIRRRRQSTIHLEAPAGGWPLVTVAVPMYNEGQSFADSIDALLAVEYPNLELIVVDDGSTDDSFEQASQRYQLSEAPAEPAWEGAGTPLTHRYASERYPNLTVLRQPNAGKAGALNTGLRFARGKYFLTLDADCLPGRHSIKKMTLFLEHERGYAGVSGMVRLRNGCQVEHGEITQVQLPPAWLLRFQALEYIRAFLVARLGMFGSRHLMIMSGAFSLFCTAALRRVDGFALRTVGEDFDVCLRLIQTPGPQGQPYLLGLLPDTTCWTIAPETGRVLFRQRKRWQRGCLESLQRSRALLINPFLGVGRWLNLWLFTLLEAASPIVELIGLLLILLLYAAGRLDGYSALVILGCAYAICVLNSLLAILIEVIRPGVPTHATEIMRLAAAALAEPVAYRLTQSLPRLLGTLDYFLRAEGLWGDMERARQELAPKDPR